MTRIKKIIIVLSLVAAIVVVLLLREKAFRSIGKEIASGDPDLFVYNENTGDCFFVEIKEKDHVTDNQRILFPLIQKLLCPVFVARVIGE